MLTYGNFNLFFFIERACAYFLVTNRPIVRLNAQCAVNLRLVSILKCKGSNRDRYTCASPGDLKRTKILF